MILVSSNSTTLQGRPKIIYNVNVNRYPIFQKCKWLIPSFFSCFRFENISEIFLAWYCTFDRDFQRSVSLVKISSLDRDPGGAL